VENVGTSEGENGSEGIEFGDWEDVELNWGLMENSQFLPVKYAETMINLMRYKMLLNFNLLILRRVPQIPCRHHMYNKICKFIQSMTDRKFSIS
jgi:hypothetical protein